MCSKIYCLLSYYLLNVVCLWMVQLVLIIYSNVTEMLIKVYTYHNYVVFLGIQAMPLLVFNTIYKINIVLV